MNAETRARRVRAAKRRQAAARDRGQEGLMSVTEVEVQAEQVPGQTDVFDQLRACDEEVARLEAAGIVALSHRQRGQVRVTD